MTRKHERSRGSTKDPTDGAPAHPVGTSNGKQVSVRQPTKLSDAVLGNARAFGIATDYLAAAVTELGVIPPEGLDAVASRLLTSVQSYHFRRRVGEMELPKPFEERKQLQKISDTAQRLLSLFGIDEPMTFSGGSLEKPLNLHPTVTIRLLSGLTQVAVNRRGDTATMKPFERLNALIILLSDLEEAARKALEAVEVERRQIQTRRLPSRSESMKPRSSKITRGRMRGGASRDGRSLNGQLVWELIDLYAATRKQYPKSGRPLAFHADFKRFMRAALKVADMAAPTSGTKIPHIAALTARGYEAELSSPSRTTDDALRAALHRWNVQTKSK